MEFRKIVLAGQQRRLGMKKRLLDTVGEEWVGQI